MSNFIFRPGPKLFNQIAELEYLCGRLASSPLAEANPPDELLEKEARYFLLLDGCQSNLDSSQLKLFTENKSLPTKLGGLSNTPSFPIASRFVEFLKTTQANLNSSPSVISPSEIAKDLEVDFPRNCRVPLQTASGSFLFQTLEHLVVASKLKKHLNWALEENKDELHPVVKAAILHLEFLQISPFNRLNQFIAFSITRARLIEAGYFVLKSESLGEVVFREQEKFFSSLRQAERTCPGSCAGLNTWLEFFCSCLFQLSINLEGKSSLNAKVQALPSSQLEILEIIKTRGNASRDQIIKETGFKTSTVKYSLTQLADKGFLVRTGGGRSTSWSVSSRPKCKEIEHQV